MYSAKLCPDSLGRTGEKKIFFFFFLTLSKIQIFTAVNVTHDVGLLHDFARLRSFCTDATRASPSRAHRFGLMGF
jgi:hypothetical protein